MRPLNAHINQGKQKRKEIVSPTITGLLGMEKNNVTPYSHQILSVNNKFGN
jgi:hypothetical protein